MEKLKAKAIVLLHDLKDGLENVECVLQQCMQDGDWGLFEQNSELQRLWRRFCDEIYKGNTARAVLLVRGMLQLIGPEQVAVNFWKAVRNRESFPFELSFRINRTNWDEFRKSVNSGDTTKTVRALVSYLERALAYLTPAEQLQTNR